MHFDDGCCLPGPASAQELVQALDALGSAGYLRGGPDVAVKGLRSGIDQCFLSIAGGFVAEYEAECERFCSEVQLKKQGRVQWFALDSGFANMGVKTVGLVCERLKSDPRVDPDCYLAGFQKIPEIVPGVGRYRSNAVKVSMRLPDSLAELVACGQELSLTELMPAATRKLGGFVDACHPHSAATTVPQGREEEFIRELQAVLDRRAG